MKPFRCFLINDDQDEHELFELALSEIDNHFEYSSSISSAEAVAMLKENTSDIPDYIFLDLNMPLLNGKDCLKELKGIQHLQNTPLVIYSTSSSDKDIRDAQKFGASHYVTKPPLLNDLIALLGSLFKKEDLPFVLKRSE